MKEHGPVLEWLADPVRVLATLNYLAGGACLVAGLAVGGLSGFIFAYVGTLVIIEVRRAQR